MTSHLRQLRAQVDRLGKFAADISWSTHQHQTIKGMLKDIHKTLAWIENPPPAEPEKPKFPHAVD